MFGSFFVNATGAPADMATSRNAWGIDIGNRALKAIKVGREGDGYRIEDFEIIEHETPLSQSGDNRDTLIAKALTEFVSRHKTGSVPVGVSVSGQQSFARFIKLPPVEEKRINDIVKFEAIQQIPFPLDDVEWSFQLFRKQDDPEVEVGIFAMRKELVNHHVSAYSDLGLNVQVVQMSPLAVYNGLVFDGKLDELTMIIDMGADTTDLVVADRNSVWHRSIPIGGATFTETLTRTFKLDYAKAEAMKRDASASKYARQIFQAMRPVFADLVAEIQRSMGFYSSTHAGAKINKVIALGGTFKLPGLQKYLQQNLAIDVEVIKAFSAAPPSDARLAALYDDSVLSAGTAYGLAVQAMGEATIVSSLLPSHIKKAKIWRDKTKWFAASAALFLAGAGVAVAGAYLPKLAYESEGAVEARDRIQKVLSEAQGLDGQWSAIESAGADERQIIKNVRSLLVDRNVWPHIVTMLEEALPKPPPELAAKDVAKIKSVPRNQRKLVQLDGWNSVYLHNVGGVLADPRRGRFFTEPPMVYTAPGQEGGAQAQVGANLIVPARDGMSGQGGGFGGGGGGGADAATEPLPPEAVLTAAKDKSGFLLRITGVTPNANPAELLTTTFLQHLLDTRIGVAGHPRELYVADAFLVRQGAIRDNSARVQELLRSHTEALRLKNGGNVTASGGGGFGGGGFGGPPGGDMGPAGDSAPGYNPGRPGIAGGPANNEDPTPYLDPLTGEDMRDDREFALVVFVVLGDPPVPPAVPPTEGAAPAAPTGAPVDPAAPPAPAPAVVPPAKKDPPSAP